MVEFMDMNEILFLTSNKHKVSEAQTILNRKRGGGTPPSPFSWGFSDPPPTLVCFEDLELSL